MGVRRGNRVIIGLCRRVRQKMEKEKKAKARAEAKAKRKLRQKHDKEFRKFIDKCFEEMENETQSS